MSRTALPGGEIVLHSAYGREVAAAMTTSFDLLDLQLPAFLVLMTQLKPLCQGSQNNYQCTSSKVVPQVCGGISIDQGLRP